MFLYSSISRTALGDHGLVTWRSGHKGPMANETGDGTLEAVLLLKVVPDQGQKDSECQSGTLSFKRQGIDTDFSDPVHVQDIMRACDLLGIGCNWEFTSEKYPEAAAWLKNNGPLPSLNGPGVRVVARLKTRAALLAYRRRRAKARQAMRDRLQRHLGPEWASTSHGHRYDDARIVVWYWSRDHHGYNIYLGGCCIRARKLKDLVGMLRRLSLPVAG